MKRSLHVALLLVIGFVLSGCGGSDSSSADEQKKIKLKFATYFPGTSPIYTDFTQPWMERVTKLTDGQVEFAYYPSEQMGKAGDLLQLTGDGVVDISVFPTNYYADQMPYSQMLASLPNLSENTGQGTKAINELFKENEEWVNHDFEKNKVKPIVYQVSPPYELWTTGKEIRLPADLEGLKIKTPGGMANQLYEFLGAVPVSISHAETYEALDRGVIQVASYYSMAVKNSGTDELLRYAIFPHIGTVIQGITINNQVWQGLPDDVKEAMETAGEEIIDRIGKVYEEETVKFNSEFVEGGGKIAELTPDEQMQWEEQTAAFTEKWLKEQEGSPLQYEELLEAYREKLDRYK